MRFMSTASAHALVVFSSIAFFTSCATQEEQVVDAFLAAVRDGQQAVLERVSVVSPSDMDVQSWEILEVGPEATEPYRLAELREAFFETTQAWETTVEDNDKFVNDHQEETLRYRERIEEDPDYEFPSGPMAEYQEEWEARRAKAEKLANQLREVEEALDRERDSIYMSANMAVRDSFEGDVTVKTIRVNVNGEGGSKTYDLTLRRYNLVDTETGITPMSRWIVSEVGDS